jgi:hypothetical protein
MKSEAPPESPRMTQRGVEKIPPLVHAVCGWPFLLAAVGGAVGALVGAAAYLVSMSAYKRGVRMPGLLAISIPVGVVAVGLWIGISVWMEGGLGG